jgi:hypothetical protein
MTTSTATPTPDVPLPAGAMSLGDWVADDPHPAWRLIEAPYRGIDGYQAIVRPEAIQYADGSLDIGRDGPTVNVHILEDNGMTPQQARALAALIVEAADQADAWAAAQGAQTK